MKHYRPVFLNNLQLKLPGLEVLRLRLNQHAPESQQWSEHAHDHGQVLVYLAGRGRQRLAGSLHECAPGSVVYVAPGTPHAFERQTVRPPLVAVLDLNLTDRSLLPSCVQMPALGLTRVRQALARLFQTRQLEQRETMLRVGAVVLEMLDPVLLAIGWLKPVNRFGSSHRFTTGALVQRMLEKPESDLLSVAQIAEKLGFQRDHLNRTLKQETGLTLGQWRARLRLRRAEKLLADGYPVNTVAERIGMDDQNYFARWFRRQTGVAPTAWKRRLVAERHATAAKAAAS